jgi:hypothetical protein
MQIDLDAILSQAKPWELELTIAGGTRAVRRCTSADLKRLFDAEKYSESANRDFVMGLFTEKHDQHAAGQLSGEQVNAIFSAVIAYYHNSITSKNAEAVAVAVATAMRTSKRGLT